MKHEPTEEVFLCNDGKYRWVYEKNLYRDLSILFLILKIFGVICAILWVFYLTITLIDSYDAVQDFIDVTAFNLKMYLLIAVLSIIGYFLYAVIMGGKYCVLFIMDDEGIMHAQQKHQVKKATLLSELTLLVGVLAKNPTVSGIGMNSARTKMYTKFSHVSEIKIVRKKETIHISGNEVYARPEDLDFVLEYISDHCPRAEIISK